MSAVQYAEIDVSWRHVIIVDYDYHDLQGTPSGQIRTSNVFHASVGSPQNTRNAAHRAEYIRRIQRQDALAKKTRVIRELRMELATWASH